jgi:hypothetical protein
VAVRPRLPRRLSGHARRLDPYFAGLNEGSYFACLREVLLDGCAPENVVLLEIEPEKQKTRVAFVVTERLTGVPTVDVSEVTVRGREVFYRRDGREVPIRRIYNRVIFDEATRKRVDLGPLFRRELDVTWVGHPNWFLLISKFSLPFLKSPYAPELWFRLRSRRASPGSRALRLEAALLLRRPGGRGGADGRAPARATQARPVQRRLINNLVRMSKGAMMGVDFNKDKTWIGACQAYHAPGLPGL